MNKVKGNNDRMRVSAFTIMEVTVSMLITAIAVAITFTASHIISVTYDGYSKKQDRVATFSVLDKLLKKDFLLPWRIVKSSDGLQVETASGLISYEFKEGYILRNQLAMQTDTFKVNAKAVEFFFEKQAVEEGGSVDQLSLEMQLDGESLSLIYKKTYSAQDLFK